MKKYIAAIKWYVIGSIIFQLLGSAVTACLPLASKMLFDTLSGEASWSCLAIVGTYIGCMALNIAFGYGSMRMSWGSAVNFEINLKQAFMHSVLIKPFHKFIKKDAGEYISFQTNDIAALEMDYLPPLVSVVNIVFSFIIYFFVIVIFIDLRVAVVLLAASFISVFLTQLSSNALGNKRAEFLQAQGEYTERVRDILEGRRQVNSRTLNYVLSVHNKSLRDTGSKRIRYGAQKCLSFMINGILSNMINISAFFCIAYLLYRGEITVGGGVASIGYYRSVCGTAD